MLELNPPSKAGLMLSTLQATDGAPIYFELDKNNLMVLAEALSADGRRQTIAGRAQQAGSRISGAPAVWEYSLTFSDANGPYLRVSAAGWPWKSSVSYGIACRNSKGAISSVSICSTLQGDVFGITARSNVSGATTKKSLSIGRDELRPRTITATQETFSTFLQSLQLRGVFTAAFARVAYFGSFLQSYEVQLRKMTGAERVTADRNQSDSRGRSLGLRPRQLQVIASGINASDASEINASNASDIKQQFGVLFGLNATLILGENPDLAPTPVAKTVWGLQSYNIINTFNGFVNELLQAQQQAAEAAQSYASDANTYAGEAEQAASQAQQAADAGDAESAQAYATMAQQYADLAMQNATQSVTEAAASGKGATAASQAALSAAQDALTSATAGLQDAEEAQQSATDAQAQAAETENTQTQDQMQNAEETDQSEQAQDQQQLSDDETEFEDDEDSNP
jgi:hypothetical protein